MRCLIVIPARMGSTRFPGKPLCDLCGKPMVQWVVERAKESGVGDKVVVATPDQEIIDACKSFDAEAVLTSHDHITGTDRIAEVAENIEADVYVNIQGDEPLIQGFVIDAAVDALLAEPDAAMSTVVHAAEPDALDDPNRVKVVLDRRGRALWFSRARIPALRNADAPPTWWQHVGLYVYRRSFLLDFVTLPQTPAERAEGLEQLRALEHGYRIATIETTAITIGVDTPDDLERVRQRLDAVRT